VEVFGYHDVRFGWAGEGFANEQIGSNSDLGGD
jgi:hypothetical protein